MVSILKDTPLLVVAFGLRKYASIRPRTCPFLIASIHEPVISPVSAFRRAEIDEETIQGVAEVLRSGWITTGPQKQQFEAELSAYCGGRPVRTFNSGTATMEIGLRIAGVGAGDEVITTPLTWVATSNVIIEPARRRCSSISTR